MDTQEKLWHQLLTARPYIDTLKLKRVIAYADSYILQRSEAKAIATINSIPTACRSVCLSEFAAYGLDQYVARSPDVQKSSIQWNGVQPRQQRFHSLPSFAALHQLTDLTIHMRNDFSGVSFAPLAKSCPSTVQSLVLHGFAWSAYREESVALSVHALSLLENYLPALTTLELGHSVVTPGEDITCLSKLKSLGFWKSTILVNDELEVSLLTNLTLLNLSKARCIWENILAPILDTFIAWPALQVLKADGCNLFGRRTNMDVTTVLEVHVDHFYGVTEPGLPGQQSYVHTAVSPGSPLQAAPPLLPLTPGQLLREGVS